MQLCTGTNPVEFPGRRIGPDLYQSFATETFGMVPDQMTTMTMNIS
jgi:hypothetical protein